MKNRRAVERSMARQVIVAAQVLVDVLAGLIARMSSPKDITVAVVPQLGGSVGLAVDVRLRRRGRSSASLREVMANVAREESPVLV